MSWWIVVAFAIVVIRLGWLIAVVFTVLRPRVEVDDGPANGGMT